MVLRFRQMGMSYERSFGPLIDELQKVYRAREESVANLQGTCDPDDTLWGSSSDANGPGAWTAS
jgi:hypothetical protein